VDLHKIWDLLRIGTPAGLAFTVNTALLGTLLFRLIGRFGTEALAATSAVYSCTALSFMPVVGIGVALTAAVGKSIGRDRKDQATRQVSICLRLSLFYMGLVGLCFFMFRHQIMAAWHLGPVASAIGAHLLICAAIFQVFDAAVITYNGALRGAGDTMWLCMITTVGACTILGLGGWCLVTFYPQWGAIGPWIAYTLHVIFVGLANRLRFKSNHWRKIDLFKRIEFTAPIEESA
jgi:MATE family multidrug resistance protein